jgi:phage-related protein
VQYYVDKNSLDYFVYGGTSSASFNFIITENDHLNSFENDFELIEIPGRSGDLVIDNKRKKNKEINIEAYIDLEGLEDAQTVVKNIKQWLQGEVTYKTLTFSNDLIEYEAIVKGPIEIVEEMEGLLNISFKFSCKEVVK